MRNHIFAKKCTKHILQILSQVLQVCTTISNTHVLDVPVKYISVLLLTLIILKCKALTNKTHCNKLHLSSLSEYSLIFWNLHTTPAVGKLVF